MNNPQKYPDPPIGSRVGAWTIRSEVRRDKKSNRFVECVCECGTVKSILLFNLYKSVSPACRKCSLKQLARTIRARSRYQSLLPGVPLSKVNRLRGIIGGVIHRCTSEKNKGFAGYGARGIGVHQAWLDDRAAFMAYLITLPGWDNPSLSLDRIENEKGYEPGNLRFATRKTQCRNRRTSRILTFRGEQMTLAEFKERFAPNFDHSSIRHAIEKTGRSLEEIVSRHERQHGVLA